MLKAWANCGNYSHDKYWENSLENNNGVILIWINIPSSPRI
jgi:hypothetical protein